MMAEKAAVISQVEKLTKDHDLSHFCSGKDSLDEWLKKYALESQKAGTAQTYVVHRAGRVIGYYSLSPGSIAVDQATARMGKGQPKQRPIPVILLARLAMDASEQGQKLGAALLKNALLRSNQAADEIGARAVLVEALDKEAVAFYQHFDFEVSPVDEYTLMLLMKDIREILSG
jgi:predicted N-acetyltransferase YhbS